jgi:hypothetical protein
VQSDDNTLQSAPQGRTVPGLAAHQTGAVFFLRKEQEKRIMATELTRVDFQGDVIEAAVGLDGEILVGFRQLCDIMEQSYDKQLEKLRSRSWATITRVEMKSPSGPLRLVTAIDLKTLHGWLLSINENKVPEAIRPKLVRYQAECVEVLERHFLRRATPTRYRPWAERFRESFAPHSQIVLSQFPQGAFTVITEGVMTMLMLEDELIRHMMEVRAGDRPCISIGLTWSHYRKNVLVRSGSLGEAQVWLPDKAMFVPVKVYPSDDLHYFKKWLHFVYLREKLQAYLDHKPELRQYGSLPRASVADNTCLTITGKHALLAPVTHRQLSASDGFCPASIPAPNRPQLP